MVLIQNVFGYIFMPLAWVMGVQWSECHDVGTLIGIKTFINEFVAYSSLSDMMKEGKLSVSFIAFNSLILKIYNFASKSTKFEIYF